jgi:hypothetical protein
LPTKKVVRYQPTKEQKERARSIAPSVFEIEWKDDGAKNLHLKKLRNEDQDGWMVDPRGTTYRTIKMIYSEERWRVPRNVACLPTARRPAVFQPTEDRKVRAKRLIEQRENGVLCTLCSKTCGLYKLEGRRVCVSII